MNTPHKWAKEIIHWANGGEIQYKDNSLMPPLSSLDTWHDFKTDMTRGFDSVTYEWRIKPEIGDLRCRLGLMKGRPYWLNAAMSEKEVGIVEQEVDFIKWVTNWIDLKDVELS